LGALVAVAMMAAAGYFFLLRPHSRPAAAAVTPSVSTSAPSQQLPATPSLQAPAPTTARSAPAPAAEPTPGSGAAANNHEHAARGASTKVGQLMVSANVSGAKIFVDGRSDPGWLTPHTIPDLSAGAHNIEISMDGYESSQQSVTVEGGQTSNVVANLSAPRAEFGVTTKPAGVEVLIDGKSYGLSPVRATLAPGNHTYTVKQPGGAPYESTVRLKSGEIITKTLTLGVAATTGIVEVRTIPPGGTVMSDGSVVGGQTPTSFRLPAGTHTLVISRSGYPPARRQVTISQDATTTVNVNLTSQ
jgi:hypothetical protein